MKILHNKFCQKQIFVLLLLIVGIANIVFSQNTNIIINEINYRSINTQEDIDFIELYNTGFTPIDLSGWQVTDAISYTFPPGTIINSGSYLVVASDPNTCESLFNFNNALGPYTGNLSSDGENIELRDQFFCEVDKVNYGSWEEWPAVRFINDGDYPISIQKINPELPGNCGGSWDSFIPSPKAINTQVYITNANNIPVIKSVSNSPNNPISGQEVIIETDLTNIESLNGTLSVNLEYQIVQPGNYIHKDDNAYDQNWISIAMLDNGLGADENLNDYTYTAVINSSIQVHRRLIRYRIKLSTTAGYNNIYPDQNHIESNYAYYVYDDYPLVGNYDINTLNPIQDITIITEDDTADEYIGLGNGEDNDGQYGGSSYLGEGTLVYNGVVYDHIRFRPRGKSGGRGDRYKPALKFDMNKSHCFAPIDGCGNQYKEKRGKLTLSGTYVNDVTTHGFTESLIHKILGLSGAMERKTDYTQFRIVDESNESDDFWGVFLIIEGYDKAYLDEHNYPEGNIWRHKSHRLTYQGDFPDSEDYEWEEDMDDVDWDLLLADKAANVFLGNGAGNYEGKHSQRDYYNSKTGKWHIWYGDYDTTFGMSSDNDTYHDRDDSDYDEDINLVQDLDGKETEFKNAMRSAYDLLFNFEQINYLIDVEAAKVRDPAAAYDWTNLDQYRWDQDYDLGNVDAQINWYRTWFQNRANWLLNDGDDGFESNNIPNKPVINLTGTTALDDLTFSNSSYSDPQGSSTFESLEWRIGEWSDPSNPVYQNICEPKYEIESVWESGEINVFSNNFTIPGTAQLEAGRTYKIRVRYKDNSDRWSHWSDAVQIISTPAQNDISPAIVINEIMYKAGEKCANEFIELKNISNTTVALDGYSFTDGIDFNFRSGTSISPGNFIVLAKDSVNFYQKYGFYPYGDYSGSLKNNGERLELSGPFNKFVDSLTYDNNNPWNELADGTGFSLELLNASLDNAISSNWCNSLNECGSPGTENSLICETAIDNQVYQDYGINITGVGYKIFDATGSEDENLEFLFVSNFGTEDRVVSGDSIFEGITFTFPHGTTILAGETVMITKDLNKYPDVTMQKFLWDDGKLNNGGEQIAYRNSDGNLINNFTYDDLLPWPEAADGGEFYLQLIANNLDNTIPSNWQAISVATLGDLNCKDDNNDGICDPVSLCEPFIVQVGNSIITESEYAQTTILSNGLVLATYEIEFVAGNDIQLIENFEVRLGASFEAKIQECVE